MLTPQFLLDIHRELAVDLFAGGGGASTGIEQALGRSVDIAINHDAEAVSLHEANHPQTKHFVSDVFAAAPKAVTGGRPVGLLWASPDCTFHSKARGGKPHRDRNQARRRRALAWVVVRKRLRFSAASAEGMPMVTTMAMGTRGGLLLQTRRGMRRMRPLRHCVNWSRLRMHGTRPRICTAERTTRSQRSAGCAWHENRRAQLSPP